MSTSKLKHDNPLSPHKRTEGPGKFILLNVSAQPFLYNRGNICRLAPMSLKSVSALVVVALLCCGPTTPQGEGGTHCGGNTCEHPHTNWSSVDREEEESKENNCFPSWSELKHKRVILQNSPCSLDILRCYCLSSTGNGSYAIGHCLYGCFKTKSSMEYYTVDDKNFDQYTCNLFNRTGLLCGKCGDGYGPPAYSFSLKCVPCQNETAWKNIIFYVTVAYGPLTVFLIIIVAFTVSTNSAPLHGWIFVCQLLSSSTLMRILTSSAELHDNNGFIITQIFGSLYGIWNLDFFRSVYRPFCLHPGLSTLQVMSLDYLIAAYPLVVIVLVYALVELHSRDYRPVVAIWRRLHFCFARFRHQLDIRTSLVDAFGTFFSLSYVKMLSTTVDLMIASEVWTDDKTPQLNMYYDGTLQFFKGEHLLFGLIGIFVFFVCTFLPLVLILVYSFPQSLKLFECFPVSVQTTIHPFMDSLLGCYKDGTNGTRNCRYFAVVYHLARIVFFVFLMWSKSTFICVFSIYICIVIGMLVAIIQPYKSAVYNTVDTILILSLGLIHTGATSYFITYTQDPQNIALSGVLGLAPLLIPLVYIIGYWGYNVCVIRKIPQRTLKTIVSSLLQMFHLARQKMKRRYATECTPLTE